MLRILKFWIVLQPCAKRHKFRLSPAFTAGFPRGSPYGRPRARHDFTAPCCFSLLFVAFTAFSVFCYLYLYIIACMRLRRGDRVGRPLCAEGIPKRHCQFESKGAIAPSESEVGDASASPTRNVFTTNYKLQTKNYLLPTNGSGRTPPPRSAVPLPLPFPLN